MSKTENAKVISETNLRSASRPQPGLRPLPLAKMDAVDRDFLPSALEILDTPPSPARVATIWVIAFGFVVALAWSWFSQLEIHAVALGRIQPSGRSKIVQTLEAGKIASIRVENSQRVREGDLLLVLDPTETTADRTALELEMHSGQAEVLRRRAALDHVAARSTDVQQIKFPDRVPREIGEREQSALVAELSHLASTRRSLLAQREEKIASRDRLRTAIGSRERIVSLARERASMRETLQDRGSLSRALVIDVLQQYESQLAQLVTERGQLNEVEALLATLDRRWEEASAHFVAEQTQKLIDAERRLAKTEQEVVKAAARQERAQIRAPISGIVQQMSVTTIGQVVAGGQPLLTIVPLDIPLEVEAFVLNKDIGFVREGQRVVVKIDAFPFVRYGSIEGQIRRISREAVEQADAQAQSDPKVVAEMRGPAAAAQTQRSRNFVYPTTISLFRQSLVVEGADIHLTPGMTVVAEIITGNRRVLDFLISPLTEIIANSGHER